MTCEIKHRFHGLAIVDTDVFELIASNAATIFNEINDLVTMVFVEIGAAPTEALFSLSLDKRIHIIFTGWLETKGDWSALVVMGKGAGVSKGNLGTGRRRRFYLEENLIKIRDLGISKWRSL